HSRTNTWISASGEPRPASRHQSDSGSTTERVPSFFEHTGISADFSSRIFWADLAKTGIGAATIDHNATTDTAFSPFMLISLPLVRDTIDLPAAPRGRSQDRSPEKTRRGRSRGPYSGASGVTILTLRPRNIRCRSRISSMSQAPRPGGAGAQ